MNSNSWDKCADIIDRLSSRVKNQQNQSAIIDNCNTMTSLCIEKSFYQCKNDIGQGCCVEVCGNCCDPIKLSNGCLKNPNINNWERSICDSKINQQFSNCIGPYRDQFTSSIIFDNKSEYIDYIITNVLRQVVNHIPFDCLHQISCCLPQKIEEILCKADVDSDRLIRIIVTDVLQCYGTNARQLTDWYAFASLIKPLLPPTKAKHGDNKTKDEMSSKPKKSPENKKNSERALNNHINTISVTSSVSPMGKKEQSSANIAFGNVISPSTDTSIPSTHRTPSTGATSQGISTTNSMTPLSLDSKEEFTPIGSKYQSKTKLDRNFVFDKINTIDHHETLPFHEKSTSTNRLSPNTSQTQHQISSDTHQNYFHHHDHRSNKSSDRSSSSDCVLTIHHKCKHKKAHKHQTTTSFDTSVSPHTLVPTKESVHKYKQTSVDATSIIIDEKSVQTTSQQNISFNSANAEQLKTSNLLNDKQMLLLKLIVSSDNATKHLHQIENFSFQLSLNNAAKLSTDNEQQKFHLRNEVEMHEHPIVDNLQLPSSKDLNQSNLSLSTNRVQMGTSSTALNEKVTRINHYPNMLAADFD